MSATTRAKSGVRFQDLVEQLPLVVYVDRLDRISSPVYLSPQIEELTGHPREAFLRDPELFLRLVHPDDRERYLGMVEARNRHAVPATGEYRLVARDGRVVWVRDAESLVAGEDGRPLYAQGYLLDVTEQRGNRLRLEAINAVLAAFSEGAPPEEVIRRGLASLARSLRGVRVSFVAFERGPQMRFLESVSDCDLAPLPRTSLPADDVSAFFALLERGEPVLGTHGSRAARFGGVFARIGGEPAAYVDVPVSRAGHLLGILSIDAREPRRFSELEVQGLTEVGRQLASVLLRERAEVDLRRRDDILSTVSRAASALLAGSAWGNAAPGLLESLGRAAHASRAYIFELGRRDDGALTASQRFEWAAEGVAPEIANPVLQQLPFVDHGLDAMGEHIVRNEVHAGFVRDMPDAARALLEPQGIQSLLTVPIHVESEPWGFIGFDDCLEEREWSAAEIDALRAASSLLAAAVVRERSEAVLREQEQKLRAVFDASFDAIFITDADRRHVDMNPAAEALYGVPREDVIGTRIDGFVSPEARAGLEAGWEEFEASDTAFGEYDLPRPDGNVRHVEYSARPNFMPGLNIAFVRDVTDKRQLEARLHAAQRLESMGRLAGGVAHDFNNLLTAISGYTSLAIERAGGDKELGDDLVEIRRAADRAAELTRQLLAFGRRQVLQPQPLQLGAIVGGVEPMVRRLVGEDVELVVRFDPAVGTVVADPGQLEQVIVNLAVNARDAMPEGGTLTMATYGTRRGDVPYVALEVTDTGIGMDDEIRSRVFEPFFTTRPDGVGLGLASVYGIVTQSEGEIEVTSEPGRGATFTMLLPERGVAIDEPAPTPAPDLVPGSETILLVEDEDIVRALVRRVLEQRGYTVLESRNGHEAVGIAETHDGDIQLLLTDVVMPGMRGHEVADRVAATRRDIRVVYMSGYADEALLGRAADGGSHLLEKPFSNEALARKVREALEADAA
jgi:two-component system cell cycle sensor histidine kinase/response regulator CckA